MTKKAPTEELFALRVTRVDLVDAGDNPEAHVTLYKRKPDLKKATPLTCPNCATTLPTGYGEKGMQVGKYCPECGAKIKVSAAGGDKVKKGAGVMADLDLSKLDAAVREQIEEHIAAQASELEAATKRATDFETAKKAAEAATKTEKARADKADAALAELKKLHPDEEDVYKGVPDEIRKRLEENEAELAKLREKGEMEEMTKRASAIELPAIKVEKLAALLHRVSKGKSTDDDVKEIERVLKAAVELAKKGGLTKGLGASGDPSHAETAFEEAIELAKTMVAEGKATSVNSAMSKVWAQNPELEKRHRAEKAARR